MRLACLLAALNWASGSMDFYIQTGSMMNEPNERVQIELQDFQNWCISQSSATSDVLLECSLSGPDKAIYQEHCQRAIADMKAATCCAYCCSPLTELELLHYAETGEKRCYESDKYCATSGSTVIPESTCPELARYEYQAILDDAYVLQEYPDLLVARGIAIA